MRGVLLGCMAVIGLLACSDRSPTPADVVGVYGAELQGDEGTGPVVTLDLRPGNAASMTLDFGETGVSRSETGTWALGPRAEIRVVLAREGFGPVTSDVTYRWTRTALTAVAFDTLRWGARGFTLARE